eukprot:TRINITY_DN20470_c0_g1_i1.p1 TRINITY_DN20470_c0_g1~~TRINITY_DN20470_c0_g1_i1.p1  ORF type:complete len:549 (+),score=121.87 TRINITY_DN20470_c0_g1_i1:140-1648(+)
MPPRLGGASSATAAAPQAGGGAAPEGAQAAAQDGSADASAGGDGAEDGLLPEYTPPKEFRPYELIAASLLANSGHLRAALNSGRQPAPEPLPLSRGGPDPPAPSRREALRPLEAACQSGHLTSVRLLLKEESRDAPLLESAAALATDAGASDVVGLLLRKGARASALAPGSVPPLMLAVRDGNIEIAEAICACADADVDAQDALGSTAVHEAVWSDSPHLLATLLERRANPSIANARGWTPLHLAAHLGELEAIARLLDANANIEGESAPPAGAAAATAEEAGGAGATAEEEEEQEPAAGGWGPLHLLLARGGQDESVAQMVAWQADPCRRGGPDKVTPLMLAISLRQEGVATMLLGLQPVVDLVDDQDGRGRCALHFAVRASSEVVVRALLAVHASPALRDTSGLTPIDVVRTSGSHAVGVAKRLHVEEVVRLVMRRCRCRLQNKYEEAELIRNELRLRGVSLDVQSERWSLPDGTWGHLSTDRAKAQAQGGPTLEAIYPT